MPEIATAVLATPGLYWLISAAVVAGMVRGFSGFGTALIFLPVAGQWLSPFEAITVMIVMDLIGPIPNIPRALRDGQPRDVVKLLAGMAVALPIGVMVLSLVAPDVFRYGVSSISLAMLVLLIGGLRYAGQLSSRMLFAAGGLGGFLAGSVGLAGPAVIMLYMAAAHSPKVIRANTMLYLISSDIMILAVLLFFGKLVFSAVGLGLLLAVPYLLANLVGAAIFRPEADRIYRTVAYVIIALSAISGLPFLD